jgi:hypothetical protein
MTDRRELTHTSIYKAADIKFLDYALLNCNWVQINVKWNEQLSLEPE